MFLATGYYYNLKITVSWYLKALERWPNEWGLGVAQSYHETHHAAGKFRRLCDVQVKSQKQVKTVWSMRHSLFTKKSKVDHKRTWVDKKLGP